MNKSYNLSALVLLLVMALGISLFNGCKKDDDEPGDANRVVLSAFGPSPALRGGELTIIGKNLDRVSAVVLPENVDVTSFTTHTPTLIKLTIPEATQEGKIILESTDGDIISISELTISEPIEITSFSPETVRPGDLVTINGDYLNLITSIVFGIDQALGDTAFVSQSKEKIEIVVPEMAQSAPLLLLSLAEGGTMPIVVETETPLLVTTPVATSMSPNPVKAGTLLTITGTDLDLTEKILFQGVDDVTVFESQSATTIEVMVPDNTHDGTVHLVPASLIQVPIETELEMLVPQITGFSPNPAKNGTDITVTGQDLDLVVSVTFGGDQSGSIQGGGSATEITVNVPLGATEAAITFTTNADKSVVTGNVLALVEPQAATVSPASAAFGDEIIIEGTDMDLVSSVIFSGDVQVDVNSAMANMVSVDVPIGAVSGPLTLVMPNGTMILQTVELELLVTTNAVITSMPAMAGPGDMISIVGTDLDEINEVIFPGDVTATMFGQKTSTLIEVFIPLGTMTGVGNIKFITFEGQEFFSPEINIQGVDPVADPSLVFFDFDALGSWWGDTGAVENDPALSLDGSSYYRVNASLSGWTGAFWRNGSDNFPGAAIGTNVDDYVLKFDINVLEPITGGVFHWRLKDDGSEGFWHRWAPWADSGSFSTNGWITVTIPLNEFTDDYGSGSTTIADLNNITSDFGLAFNEGDSQVNVCIDNVRFELQ
ncbi:MAG: glycan-binding surface protein [Lewinella sp.]|jgi:hypothetical protein|uniref:glycan-binding surface protein n=1 Tax=Lewinella sp. TaxID=2004506 RepID=UPI003D6B8235